MATQDFEQQTTSFLDWFKNIPGATFHEDIKLTDLRGDNAGRGIVATADIPPDAILFTIPRSSILSVSTSSLPAKLPSVFSPESQDDASLDEDSDTTNDQWIHLILCLIHEHFLDTISRWKPYLDVLPAQFNSLMYWAPEELKHLKPSAIVDKIGKAEADAMITTKIIPVIRSHAELFPGSQDLTDSDLLALAHRMGSILMSYGFDLESDSPDPEQDDEENDGWEEDTDGTKALGMVMMADMLNADAEFNAHIGHGEESLTATSLREIKEGEEVLNYYGELGNGELLRRYGYCTERHARYDVCEVQWEGVGDAMGEVLGLVRGKLKAKKVNTMIKKLIKQGEVDDSFVLERDAEPPTSEGLFPSEPASFAGFSEEIRDAFKTVVKALRKASLLPADQYQDSDSRKKLFLQVMSKALKARRAEYQIDEARLADVGLGWREKMALTVKIGEVKVLDEAVEWVREQLGEDDGKGPEKEEGGDGPEAKRRKVG